MKKCFIIHPPYDYGHMAELVDALVSGTSGATLGSSSLLMPTICAGDDKFWGCSSVDRALRSHRRGRGFESHQLHQGYEKNTRLVRIFFLHGA